MTPRPTTLSKFVAQKEYTNVDELVCKNSVEGVVRGKWRRVWNLGSLQVGGFQTINGDGVLPAINIQNVTFCFV